MWHIIEKMRHWIMWMLGRNTNDHPLTGYIQSPENICSLKCKNTCVYFSIGFIWLKPFFLLIINISSLEISTGFSYSLKLDLYLYWRYPLRPNAKEEKTFNQRKTTDNIRSIINDLTEKIIIISGTTTQVESRPPSEFASRLLYPWLPSTNSGFSTSLHPPEQHPSI